jgi:hypothetical protein
MIQIEPGGMLNVYYRTSGFDSTESSSWTQLGTTMFLDATFQTRQFFINRTSERIQFGLMNAGGSTFEVREMEVMEPVLEENR